MVAGEAGLAPCLSSFLSWAAIRLWLSAEAWPLVEVTVGSPPDGSWGPLLWAVLLSPVPH